MTYLTDVNFLTEDYLNYMAGPAVDDSVIEEDIKAQKRAEYKGESYERKYPFALHGNYGGGWSLVEFESLQGMYRFVWKK